MNKFKKNSKQYSDEAIDAIYKEMWTRLHHELVELDKKYSVTETVQNYVDGEKYGPIMEKRYYFSMSVDDILNLMSWIDTSVRLEKFGPKIL